MVYAKEIIHCWLQWSQSCTILIVQVFHSWIHLVWMNLQLVSSLQLIKVCRWSRGFMANADIWIEPCVRLWIPLLLGVCLVLLWYVRPKPLDCKCVQGLQEHPQYVMRSKITLLSRSHGCHSHDGVGSNSWTDDPGKLRSLFFLFRVHQLHSWPAPPNVPQRRPVR